MGSKKGSSRKTDEIAKTIMKLHLAKTEEGRK